MVSLGPSPGGNLDQVDSFGKLSSDSNSDPIAIDDCTPPTETLTVMVGNTTNKTELLNRWIVDPGSNTHVINTEAWKGWKKTSDNLERRYVNAGNSRILITAWGTMELVARTLYGL